MTVDNRAIAGVLDEVAALLELKGENPFKIRAYRNGADVIRSTPDAVASLDDAALRELPGIGKDLAARIGEIVRTGTCTVHQELLARFPPTLLELLRLQGVGPKTVAQLYADLAIRSLDDLEQALKAGRVRELKGMGRRKEELLTRAIEERKQHANRHLLGQTVETAESIVAHLTASAPGVSFHIVGSARRGTETCGDIDILAVGSEPVVMASFIDHPLVERILAHGDTKASVLLRGGFQADLRHVAVESAGAALQYFTGSKAHNIALRDRALARGWRLNEYGLYRAADEHRLAGETEESIYGALDLPWIPPELREHRGELEAAGDRQLPTLVTHADLRGDLHMHTTETDGKDTLEDMVHAARAAGLEYVAITDHSQALAMANGLDETRALAHAKRIRDLDARTDGIRVLAGIECDILSDGTLDLADDCLAQLDLVVASIHSAMRQDEDEVTARLLRAIENPWVDIIGHPTGRMLLRREPARVNMTAVARAAARHGVALEINSQMYRLDLSDVNALLAREHGVKLVISSDAHSRAALSFTRWGAVVARRAWATRDDVLNTRPIDELLGALRRNRRGGR